MLFPFPSGKVNRAIHPRRVWCRKVLNLSKWVVAHPRIHVHKWHRGFLHTAKVAGQVMYPPLQLWLVTLIQANG